MYVSVLSCPSSVNVSPAVDLHGLQVVDDEAILAVAAARRGVLGDVVVAAEDARLRAEEREVEVEVVGVEVAEDQRLVGLSSPRARAGARGAADATGEVHVRAAAGLERTRARRGRPSTGRRVGRVGAGSRRRG